MSRLENTGAETKPESEFARIDVDSGSAESRVRILSDDDIQSVSPRLRKGFRHEEIQSEYRDLVSRLRMLRTREADAPFSIAVTAASRRTGVTTVATNLALALAESHTGRTLLVDGNGARPAIHRVFQIQDQSIGFTNTAASQTLTPDAVYSVKDASGLFVMPVGDLKQSSALRDPALLEGTLETLKCDFDFIVLDLPPCYQPSNGLVLASLADASLLVVQSEVSKRKSVRRTQQWMHDAGANLVGTVLNKHRDPLPWFLKPFFS